MCVCMYVWMCMYVCVCEGMCVYCSDVILVWLRYLVAKSLNLMLLISFVLAMSCKLRENGLCIYVFTCVCVCVYVYVCMYVRVCMCICVCMYACVCSCTYMYI